MIKKILSALLLATTATNAAGAGVPATDVDHFLASGKPRAPLRIEWIETGADGRLVAEVSPEADFERLEIILVLPDRPGPRPRMVFPAGRAGDKHRVEWPVPQADIVPRVLVIMETGGERMKRAGSPPGSGLDKSRLRRQSSQGRVDHAAGLRVLPATRGPER